MEYVTLNNGVKCPVVGIGTFMLAPADAENSVKEALKMGYSLVDTANAYVNERACGRGIAGSEIDRFFEEEGLTINEVLSAKDEYTTYNLVEAGLGISINQEMIGSRWTGRVRMIPVSPARYVEIALVCPPKNEMSPAAKRFAEMLL